MKSKCEICNKSFKFTYNYLKNIQYIPKVCGSDCFAKLLKKEKETTFLKPILSHISDMRSGYERGMAVWLYNNGFHYKYEPFVYDNYMPDFLVSNNIIIETKGLWERNYYTKFKKFFNKYKDEFKIYLLDFEFLKRIKCKPLKIGEVYEFTKRN